MKRYETRDLSPALLAALLGVLLGGAVLLDGSLRFGLRRVRPLYETRAVRPMTTEAAGKFPAPRLEIDESENLRRYLESERRKIESYEWVDRAHGIARIPVERAMVLDAAVN
jgi:hypothetical protein